MKGQLTFTNLLLLFVAFLLFTQLVPVLQDMINTSAATLLSSPNDKTDLVVSLMELSPFVLLLGLVLTAINYARPRVEGG